VHPEDDPTATEPDEAPKPEIPGLPPEEGEEPPTEQQELEAEAEFEPVGADEAHDNDTFDDGEERGSRHDDLPDGARREDYDDENVG
jgi:hypothetical protein